MIFAIGLRSKLLKSPLLRRHGPDCRKGGITAIFMSHTILALHYWAGSGHEFDVLRPLLPPHMQLLAPDLPGFGQQSIPVGFDFSVHAYANWVAAYLQQQQIGEYTLLGHSMGGKIALALAARQPAGLQRLVLLAPSPPTPEPMTDADRAAALEAYGNPQAAAETFDKITRRPVAAALREQVMADNLRCSHAAWDAWLQLGSRENIAPLMPEIQVPCHMIVGAADAAIVPATQYQHTLPLLPAGTLLTEVPAAGHLLPLEAPEVIADVLNANW